jgi:hypothetical protein
MRCGRCRREDPSVVMRDEPPVRPMILCDLCYEYEKTWYEFQIGDESSRDSTKFFQLYDRLSDLSAKIDEIFKQAREESEKKAGFWMTKKPEWAWDDRF